MAHAARFDAGAPCPLMIGSTVALVAARRQFARDFGIPRVTGADAHWPVLAAKAGGETCLA